MVKGYVFETGCGKWLKVSDGGERQWHSTTENGTLFSIEEIKDSTFLEHRPYAAKRKGTLEFHPQNM